MENTHNQLDSEIFNRIGKHCLCANVRKASRLVTKLYDEYLKPSGLLATQFIILSSIASQSSSPLTPLAEQLGMDPTTLARNLKPLERDGLIQILKGEDRRTRILRLSEQGMTVLESAIPLWEQAQSLLISQLGEERCRIMLGDWSDIVSLTG